MIELGFPASYSNSPSWAFQRGQSGASSQSSCTSGRDGLRAGVPLNEDTPARGGEASASPFRPVGEEAARIAARAQAAAALRASNEFPCRLVPRVDPQTFEDRIDDYARRHVESNAERIG